MASARWSASLLSGLLWSSGLSAILNGRLIAGVLQECCSLHVFIFVILAVSLEVWSRFGISSVEFILIWMELQMVYKTNKKTRRGLIISRLYLPVRSDLSEELCDSETPFWSSALDFERDLPSTVCSILSAKELIVLQESWLPLLAFPLVPAVVPSVCRSHGSIILLVL